MVVWGVLGGVGICACVCVCVFGKRRVRYGSVNKRIMSKKLAFYGSSVKKCTFRRQPSKKDTFYIRHAPRVRTSRYLPPFHGQNHINRRTKFFGQPVFLIRVKKLDRKALRFASIDPHCGTYFGLDLRHIASKNCDLLYYLKLFSEPL